jgi:hypothetical protein
MLNAELKPATSYRVLRSQALRTGRTEQDAFVAPPAQIDNGDEARYADKSGTYTKGVLQAGIGLVDLAAYKSFKNALAGGAPEDFEKIVLGGPRTLNGPQAGLSFYLDCLDSSQFVVPPAPALASEAYAAELLALYWASLLRDLAFTDYSTSAFAAQAAGEISSLPAYAGPRNSATQVTPNLLFRGRYDGETIGPYVSQFLLQPTTLGSLPITQQYITNKPGIDFMTVAAEFLQVQNGIATGKSLVLNTINNGEPAPLNPGNPYVSSKTQNGFGTMGQPDIAATLAAVAREAINAVWYHKWWVHLRHRPESGGAIVHLQKTGQSGSILGHVSNTVLQSKAVQKSFTPNNSYFLSQAFPEGSPTHPSYPTGHGAVAGACITVLKFFFDGTFTIKKPMVPSSDGMTLNAYVAPSGEPPLSVNGELHKLAHNISFGHGIHAGIHWRSDSDTSIEFGEAVALSYLRDWARTYNEQFRISLTKLDGTIATISNP